MSNPDFVFSLLYIFDHKTAVQTESKNRNFQEARGVVES